MFKSRAQQGIRGTIAIAHLARLDESRHVTAEVKQLLALCNATATKPLCAGLFSPQNTYSHRRLALQCKWRWHAHCNAYKASR